MMRDRQDARTPRRAARTSKDMDKTATLFEALLGRPIDASAAAGFAGHAPFSMALELLLSTEVTERLLAESIEHHLLFLHRARKIMSRRLLPPARRIIDLGGANAPLYRCGYPHRFERMVMVDLPPEDRHAMYRNLTVEAPEGSGEVVIHYGDMTHLEAFEDGAFDLAWSGESIEHVDLEAGRRMIAEAYRVLEPGGWFCLDTPNRGLTEIHTRGFGDGFIHPDHRHEYRAGELRALLEEAGFEIVTACGVCEMPQTRATGQFAYTDFLLGNPIATDIEDGYLLFFACRKPG